MSFLKTAAAIHDISGYGKCSLTVVLPILSAAGIETSVMPTAVLSTHTGSCFNNYYCQDLTEGMKRFTEHWETINPSFGAIYSGYLGSYEQIDIVRRFIDRYKKENTLVLVDPVLGDDGSLYPLYTEKMVEEIEKLCLEADIIVPNITEAALLTGREYKEPPHSKQYINGLVLDLAEKFGTDVVLTGVSFDEKTLGAAAFDKRLKKIEYLSNSRVEDCSTVREIFLQAFCCAEYCAERIYSFRQSLRLILCREVPN